MPLNASEFIWLESVESLAARWYQREVERGEKPKLMSRDLASRLQSRVDATIKYVGLSPAKPLTTPRQWEASWDPAAQDKRLREAFAKFGITLRIVEQRNVSPQALAAASPFDENTLVIQRPLAQQRAEQYAKGGLTYRFTAADALVIIMAEELFLSAADRMGHKTAFPVVEEVAPAVFAQELLGLPFNPWAADFLTVE